MCVYNSLVKLILYVKKKGIQVFELHLFLKHVIRWQNANLFTFVSGLPGMELFDPY